MARKHEAVKWLTKGHSPSKIARQMGVSVSTVMGYLYNQVGEGKIRRSDIVFSINERIRQAVETVVATWSTRNTSAILRKVAKILADPRNLGDNLNDARVYLRLRDARIALGDMYEFIRDIEVSFHRAVRDILETEHGPIQWWRRGVPSNIRAECAAAREQDDPPANDPYCYTTFIHLKEILDRQWGLFSKILPKELSRDKRTFLTRLVRLNQIRNNVMHPVRGTPLTAEDFAFVRDSEAYFQFGSWKLQAAIRVVEAHFRKHVP